MEKLYHFFPSYNHFFIREWNFVFQHFKKYLPPFSYLLTIALITVGFSNNYAQTTIFSDDFSINTNVTFTAVGPIGSSAWSVSRSGDDWGARRNTSPEQLELTNDASTASNANGWVFVSTPSSSFSAPYNTTLNLNPGVVTWNFNMRQIRTNPAGFGGTSYGVAFVLAGTSDTNNDTGSGYVIVLGQSGATDPIRLAKYNNGIQGTLTNIITSNTTGLADFGNEYLSIRITYDPDTDTWKLFLRDDGSSTFSDPAISSLTSQGTAVDATYTGTSLPLMGAWWNGSTAANQTAFFDNISVTVLEAPTCNDGIQNGDETGVDCGGPDCPACPQPVKPVLECVKLNNDGSYTAVFGYLNENAGEVGIPVGVNNELTPATQNGLLPTTFLPGLQVAAFEIPFNGTDLTWTLEGPDGSRRTATANANSSACPPDFDCPSLMADIGDPCDDSDPGTENDMVNSDCECEGMPVVASEIDLTLDADNTIVACGETVTVEVDISDYTDIVSLSFSINFDPSELDYVSYEEITLDGETPIVGEPGVGSVPSDALTYTWLSGGFSGSTGSAQTILRIEFVMLLDAGTTTVTISDNPTTIEAADGNTFDLITVNVGPDLTLTGDEPAPPTCPNDLKVCVSDAAIDLTMLTPGANPAGGTFSGDGVTNNSFDPATAGTGAHTIMYEYTNDQGCTSSCEFEIMVISCEPEISVTDPCSCKNNATTLDNGQFDEFVSLVAPSGQT